MFAENPSQTLRKVFIELGRLWAEERLLSVEFIFKDGKNRGQSQSLYTCSETLKRSTKGTIALGLGEGKKWKLDEDYWQQQKIERERPIKGFSSPFFRKNEEGNQKTKY